MIEEFINYVGAANLGFILLLILVYLLGTKKSIKNLNDRINCGIEENRDFRDICKVTGELKNLVDNLKRSNGSLTKSEEQQRYQIVKLQNDLRKISENNPQEDNEDIKILKKEIKILKKEIKKIQEVKQPKRTTLTP